MLWCTQSHTAVSAPQCPEFGTKHGRCGVVQAAQALLHEEMSHLSALSKALPGYQVQLVGHSLGAGVAAIVTYLLNYR